MFIPTVEPPARLTVSAGKDARMSIEIKQVHKLSQQLVMTPQLQQAIKLLQLSRMELVDLVREEMMENPVLEDGAEIAQEMGKDDPDAKVEAGLSGETELSAPSESTQATTEVTGNETSSESQAVNEIDWENYIDSYSSGPTTRSACVRAPCRRACSSRPVTPAPMTTSW